ncbi:hypothetical protein SLITK23_23400 [Streptomyces lividans]|nr:hypothetical protein SLITK23_23400 [Streptomyces lividans]
MSPDAGLNVSVATSPGPPEAAQAFVVHSVYGEESVTCGALGRVESIRN